MKNFKLLSLLLVILLLILLLFWRSCGNSNNANGCDNSINNWEHFIPKSLAKLYIDSLKAKQAMQPGIHKLDSCDIAVAELYVHAKDMMRNMMLRDSCDGIRIYYGLKMGRIIPIVCGTKSVAAGKGDIYWQYPSNYGAKSNPNARIMSEDTDGLLDASQPEPPQMVSPSLH